MRLVLLVCAMVMLAGCSWLPSEDEADAKPEESLDTLSVQFNLPGVSPLYEGYDYSVSAVVTNAGSTTISGAVCMKVNGVDRKCEIVALAPGQSFQGWRVSLPSQDFPATLKIGHAEITTPDAIPIPKIGEWNRAEWVDVRLNAVSKNNDGTYNVSLDFYFHNETQDVQIVVPAGDTGTTWGPGTAKSGDSISKEFRVRNWNGDVANLSIAVTPIACQYFDHGSACASGPNGNLFRWQEA